MATSTRFLYSNGVVSRTPDTPSVSAFLESRPGAYTTTRTHNNASCLLFWERHLRRLANSARILFNSSPELLFKPTKSAFPFPSLSIPSSRWESVIQALVNESMHKVLPIALKERSDGEEFAITTLVSGDLGKVSDIESVDGEFVFMALDMHVHVGSYVPPVFGFRENGAHLALVGAGRKLAAAKYSDWVRLRKPLEKLRPPSISELLLSNDGDQILEGSITNFFVVCRKENNEDNGRYLNDYERTYSFEVQTAPVSDGILPGVIRQLVIEVCMNMGIPLREVAPSWSKCETWEEAFITNSLRVLQHVETIQVPSSWESLESRTWKEVSWKEKRFKDGPGMITTLIQNEIMVKAALEGLPSSSFMW